MGKSRNREKRTGKTKNKQTGEKLLMQKISPIELW
jgi:hypothetical protein